MRSTACDRVRSYVSLDLDGELSGLERRMLSAHLGHCAGCRAYAAEVVGFTDRLRAERPALPARMFVVSRHRRRPLPIARVAQVAAAAAAVVVAGGLGTTLGGTASEHRSALPLRASTEPKLIDGYLVPPVAVAAITSDGTIAV